MEPLPPAAALSILATAALVHVYVVPTVALVGVYTSGVPPYTAVGVSVLVNTGVGFTATVTLKVLGFIQPPAVIV